MKKVFISQPMVDKTDEEIKAVRNKIIEEIRAYVDDDVEVIDSFLKARHMMPNRYGS